MLNKNKKKLRSIKNTILFYAYVVYIKTIKIELPKKTLNKNAIISVYHEGSTVFTRVLYLLLKTSQPNFCILMSNHQDADLIERITNFYKINSYRFDWKKYTSNLINYLKLIKSSGNRPVLAVDGPVGPYRTIQPGIIFLHDQLKKPIQAIFLKTNTSLRIKTWDHHIFPLPFSRVKIFFSPTFYSKHKNRSKNLKEFKCFLDHNEEILIKM